MITGTWSPLGYNLPDLGITEQLSGGRGGTTWNNPNLWAQPTPAESAARWKPGISSSIVPSGPQLPTSRPPGGGTGPGPGIGGQIPAGQTAGQNIIKSQTDNGLSQIDTEFQNFMTQLSGQEQSLRAQGPVSEQKINAAYAPATTAVKEQQAQKISGLEGQASTVETQRQSQLQQNRDLFRQMQQQNIAQLSGMGISSSSVAEALAENLGVETARRIASTSQSADDVIRSIEKEKVNVNDFAQQKLSDIEQQKAAQISDLQQTLVNGLNAINQARQIAAADKAQRRQDLLAQAQQAAFQLEQNAQNFQQSIQMWQQQTQAGLAAAGNTDYSTYFNNLMASLKSVQNLNTQLGNANMQATYEPDKYGYLKPGSITQKKPTLEDQYGLSVPSS